MNKPNIEIKERKKRKKKRKKRMSCWSHTGASIVTPPYREEVASLTVTESIKPQSKHRERHTHHPKVSGFPHALTRVKHAT